MNLADRSISYEILRGNPPEPALGLLTQGIISCINNAFGNIMPENEVLNALNADLIFLAIAKTSLIVGFCSLARGKLSEIDKFEGISDYSDQDKLFHLKAGVISKDFQGRGIYRSLNKLRLEEVTTEKGRFVLTFTQNPKVEKGLQISLDKLVTERKIEFFEKSRSYIPKKFKRRLTSYHIDTKGTPYEQLDINAGDAFSLLFTLDYFQENPNLVTH